jgi:hypothetical protein
MGHPEKISIHLRALKRKGRNSLLPCQRVYQDFKTVSMGEMPQGVGHFTQGSRERSFLIPF